MTPFDVYPISAGTLRGLAPCEFTLHLRDGRSISGRASEETMTGILNLVDQSRPERPFLRLREWEPGYTTVRTELARLADVVGVTVEEDEPPRPDGRYMLLRTDEATPLPASFAARSAGGWHS